MHLNRTPLYLHENLKMKAIISFVFVLFLFSSIEIYGQCNDSSNVTLDETKDWIVAKINAYGGRIIPPTKYYSSFKETKLKVFEIGMNDKFELKDTTTQFEIDIRDIDIAKLTGREIGKNGKFGLSLNPKNGKSLLKSPILGALNGLGFELIIQTSEANMDERLIKAIKHAHCLVTGNSSNNKQQEKF